MENTTQLENFLALPDLAIVTVAPAGSEGFTLYCKKTTDWEACPKCAQPSWSVKEHRPVKVKDAPIRGKAVLLVISKRRFRCYHCNKAFMEPVSGISKGKRTTERYRRHVAWLAEHFANLDDARRAGGCSTGYLYKAHYETLAKKPRTGGARCGQALSVSTSIH